MSIDRPLPRLKTPRLFLTIPEAASAEKMVTFLQDNRDHLRPWSPPEPLGLYSVPQWQKNFPRNRLEYFKDLSMRLVVFLGENETGPIIGETNFTQICRGPCMCCSLGYKVHFAYQGQGYVTEALRAGIAYIFEELKLHRIQANYMPENLRSGRVLARLGFVIEGYADNYVFINGGWRRHILTSLTNPVPINPD